MRCVIIKKIGAKDAYVIVFHNPHGLVAYAMNVALCIRYELKRVS